VRISLLLQLVIISIAIIFLSIFQNHLTYTFAISSSLSTVNTTSNINLGLLNTSGNQQSVEKNLTMTFKNITNIFDNQYLAVTKIFFRQDHQDNNTLIGGTIVNISPINLTIDTIHVDILDNNNNTKDIVTGKTL
jgi:hypothetical protein